MCCPVGYLDRLVILALPASDAHCRVNILVDAVKLGGFGTSLALRTLLLARFQALFEAFLVEYLVALIALFRSIEVDQIEADLAHKVFTVLFVLWNDILDL